uniref:ShKT domain-containing protein n=1 Tax=Acrobeloides nanus TaxID=290746 RepID=A0A914D185_9BILA
MGVAWKFLFVFLYRGLLVTQADELIYLQSVWRHGDRPPLNGAVWPTNPYQEPFWTGKQQHINLGKKLRDRYITDLGFVSPNYDQHEIFIQSTNFPRTIQSAQANMQGFYDNLNLMAPINKYGYFGPGYCSRTGALWGYIQQTPEYQALMANQSYQHFVYNQTAGNDYEAQLLDMFPQINQTNDLYLDWNNGIGLAPYRGLDFSHEMPQAADGGGFLLRGFIGLINGKIYCRNTPSDKSDFCNWANPLKYYVYSAHDDTIAAALASLGCNNNCPLNTFINRSMPYLLNSTLDYDQMAAWCNVPLCVDASDDCSQYLSLCQTPSSHSFLCSKCKKTCNLCSSC